MTKSLWDGCPTIKVGNFLMYDIRLRYPDVAGGYPHRSLTSIKRIVQHHSAETFMLVGGSPDVWELIDSIYHWHTVDQGWPGIGYHYLVDPWGHIYKTGGCETARYHVASKNAESVGVCALGNFSYYMPSCWQLMALRALHAFIRHGLGQHLPLVGHGELAVGTGSTSCPGATFPMWRAVIDTLHVPHLVGGDMVGNLVQDWLERSLK